MNHKRNGLRKQGNRRKRRTFAERERHGNCTERKRVGKGAGVLEREKEGALRNCNLCPGWCSSVD